MHVADVVLAAGPCPDLSALKPVVDRLVGLLLAVIGASFLAVVVYAGVKYETALGRQEGIMQAKEILTQAGKGDCPGCPRAGARRARQVGAGLRGAMRVLRAAAAATVAATMLVAPVTAASAAPAQVPCRAAVVSSRCPAASPTPGSELVDPAAPGLPDVTITFATPVTPTATAGGGGGFSVMSGLMGPGNDAPMTTFLLA